MTNLAAVTYRASAPSRCQKCCQALRPTTSRHKMSYASAAMTATFGGGPEGIRTPDLLNAICRAGVHGGPSRPASVFDFRALLYSVVHSDRPRSAASCCQMRCQPATPREALPML